VRVSAKADYAVRAAVELARAAGTGPMKGERIAAATDIPLKFLENILAEMRHSGLVASQRGSEGGYWLARPPDQITLADVLRAVEGPLAAVQGVRPDALEAGPYQDVWVAVRANLRAVLEKVTCADVAKGKLPASVRKLVANEEAWEPR
jgi:Rrf2 family protein